MERRLVHKLPHHRRNLVAVNRSYNSDGIGAKIKSPLPHGLRNADKLIVKLLCGIKAVADACEIQVLLQRGACPKREARRKQTQSF